MFARVLFVGLLLALGSSSACGSTVSSPVTVLQPRLRSMPEWMAYPMLGNTPRGSSASRYAAPG